MTNDASLRDHLVRLLTSDWAHVAADGALAGIPPRARGVRPKGHAHSVWQLLEHLRLCQEDLVAYCRRADHESPPFPDGYWPSTKAPPGDAAWKKSVAAFRQGLREMVALVNDPSRDLLAPLPWSAEGHTVLREAMILADHNAYHLGQIVQLKKALKS